MAKDKDALKTATVLAFEQPGCERRIKIIGVPWKPACKLIGEPTAGVRMPTLGKQRLNLAHRIEHRGVFIDMAVARRKIGVAHPLVFLTEMRFEMIAH